MRGESVVVHEATAFAGGRCRSYHDATLGMTIDNGNHLLLSGNHAARAYLRADRRRGPPGRPAHCELPVLRSRHQRAMDAAHQRRPPALVDFRSAQARARHPRHRIPAARASVVGRARSRSRRGRTLQRARSTSGWCGRCCSLRSTSSRRRARPGSRGAVMRETLAAGGQRLPAAGRARRTGRRIDRAGAVVLARAQLRRCGSGISFTRCARSDKQRRSARLRHR